MANQEEVKLLVGSMDRENSPESIGIYDYMEAHNIRSVGNDESDANYLSNLEGNINITINLPLGQNRCVGSAGFENVSKAYFVRYNSAEYHQIVEFDYDTNTETVIFENLTDSGNENIFTIPADSYFSDIRLMHDKFLILSNSANPIYCLNVESFKENRGSRVVIEEDLLLHKNPSLTPPETEYLSNTERTSNALRGNLFQFRTQFEYEDFRSSTWSTVSKRNVPEDEASSGQGQNVVLNNVLKVRVDAGDDRVEKINIGVRSALDNWLLARTVDRDRIITLPNTDITSTDGNLNTGQPTEAYDPVTNEYIFLFYNDGLYPVLDQVEVESQYDYIPHTAETVEIINGNVLALGGLTEGYDRPELDDVTVTATYYEPNITGGIIGDDDPFRVSSITFYWGSGQSTKNWNVDFWGDPKVGDRFIIELKAIGQVVPNTLEYVVTATDESNGRGYTLNAIANSFASQIPGGTLIQVHGLTNPNIEPYIYFRSDNSGDNWELTSAYVRTASLGTLDTQSIPTLKAGASYQLAYAPFDKHGRNFPIVTDERFIVKLDSIAKQGGTEIKLPQINWSIGEDAPEGAVGYHILMTENQTYQDYITLTGRYDSTEGGGGEYLVFDITSLSRFNEFESESQVSYDFTKGDKVTMIRTVLSSGITFRYFRYPFIELDIVDFEIRVNPDDATDVKYLLKVRNTDLFNPLDYEDMDVVMEIFTPKKQGIGSEEGEEPTTEFFYETGLTFPVIDGKNSVTSGTIFEGDSYYRGRIYEHSQENTGMLIFVQDPNFSDNYESEYWSAGRARTYDDEMGRTERKASIRYSDEYIYGSKYNGMSRFYVERIYGEKGGETTSKYGWIRRLESRDNALVCIQEFKGGVIPVYKSIIYDNTDTSLVADSGRIFGSVQLRNGNFGCGNAKESIVATRDGLIYFFDDNNCLPIRDSLSGIDVIDRNMTSYFVKYAKEAKDKGAKFIGYYDNYNNEYNLTIESVGLRILRITFDEAVYQDAFIPPINTVVVSDGENGTASITGNSITYTPDEDYIGTDQLTITYPGPDSTTITKYIDLNVLEGDNTPTPFGFASQNNRPLAVMSTSNPINVSEINMPSPISIVNGEYQINGGDWVSTPGTVVNNDAVRVRHLSSSDYETSVVTTLTIGGVSGTFTTTTIEEDISPEINEVYAELSENINGTIRVTLRIDYPIVPEFTISGTVQYELFGSVNYIPVSFTLPGGESSVFVATSVRPDNFANTTGQLNIGSSNDTPIECIDGEIRLLHKVQVMVHEG